MKDIRFAKRLLAIMLFLTFVALPGCGEKGETGGNATVSGEDVKKETKESYETTRAYTQEQIKAFLEQTKKNLAEYMKEIDQLQAYAENLEGETKAKAEQQLAELGQKYEEVSETLKELNPSDENGWKQIKSNIDTSMEDLGNACKKAATELDKSLKE